MDSNKNVANIKKKNKRLEKQNRNLKRKYEALSKSKLGKLTLKYWSLKKGKK